MVVGTDNMIIQNFLPPVTPVEWPVSVGRPPAEAQAFQVRPGSGAPGFRDQLERVLASGDAAAITHVVVGDAGTGKTQLAIAAFARAKVAGTDLRVWVSATSRDAVLAGCAQAADLVQAPGAVAAGDRDAGHPAANATALEDLLTDMLRVLGPDHAETLATRADLADWRMVDGDPAGAAAATEDLLTARLRLLGPDHPETLGTRANLALFRGEAGGSRQRGRCVRGPPPRLRQSR